MIRSRIQAAQTEAMKARDSSRVATIRLILAALKNRDIEARTGAPVDDDDAMVVDVLQKMVKQRRESIALFTQGNRPELAEAEAAEIAVISAFLPQMLSDAEARAAIEAIAQELGANSVKDMGRVMAALKARHGQVIDMGQASALVKAALS